MVYPFVNIRPMTDFDLPRIMEIEDLCFVAPWKEKDIRYEIHENPVSNIWVIEVSHTAVPVLQVVGFADYWNTFDSGTICQIAIHPNYQGYGLGSKLMEEIIKDARAKKVRTLTLEVRESNKVAIKYYQKHGFKISHIKESYYSNGENAIYMIMEVL